jgi:serine/threonine protein phosphatase PrpC
MNIVTGEQKKNTKKLQTLKNYGQNIYRTLIWPFRYVYSTLLRSKKGTCPKCNTLILSFYPCPRCGYKTLNKKQLQVNMNYSHFSYEIEERANREYEMSELSVNLAYVSDIGERHHENQDSGIVKEIGEWKFMGVSDGVSRSNSPKIASTYALEQSYEYLKTIDLNKDNALQELKNAIQFAHGKIKAVVLPEFDPDYDPPEATIVIALVKDTQAFIGWVGDSRAYLMHSNVCQILTRDDSWVMVAVENGMSFKEANESPMAHAITQCMGMKDLPIVPHVLTVDITNKDLLLCSDGLWNYFDDEELIHELYRNSPGSAQETGIKLVNAANMEGGRDNITVAILKQ